MPEWIEMFLAFMAGGWLATFVTNRFYRRAIVREMIALELAEIRKKKAKVDAETDEIYERRIGA